LRIGVADDKVYAGDSLMVHVGDGVTASSSNADNFNDVRLVLWQVKFQHVGHGVWF